MRVACFLGAAKLTDGLDICMHTGPGSFRGPYRENLHWEQTGTRDLCRVFSLWPSLVPNIFLAGGLAPLPSLYNGVVSDMKMTIQG